VGDTIRTRSYLQTAFADNTAGNISAQNGRDLIVSSVPFIAVTAPTVNNDNVDTAGVGATFREGSLWFDTLHRALYACFSGATGAAVWVALVPNQAAIPGPTPNFQTIRVYANSSLGTPAFAVSATPITVFTMPAGGKAGIANGAFMKLMQTFTGPGLTAATLNIGTSGSVTAMISNFNLRQVVTDGTEQTFASANLPFLQGAGTPLGDGKLNADIVTTGCAVSALTAGFIDICIPSFIAP
jgi:hypothetical protein